jgi:hypothetical protein
MHCLYFVNSELSKWIMHSTIKTCNYKFDCNFSKRIQSFQLIFWLIKLMKDGLCADIN